MTALPSHKVLSEVLMPSAGNALWAKRAALVVLGVAALAVAAKIKVPMWPVPITMQTFVLLLVGAGYGARLGLLTIAAYLAVGALGFDVFTSSGPENNGLAYMMGSTGGYLAGYLVAVALMGWLARRGWDRSIAWTALALLAANVAIYVPGLWWLGQLYGWDQPILAWGLYPFLLGDALKLALAALLLPGLWRLVGPARG
ncbi:MAG: biotin transporter BioY [Pseudomonadota bacterium]